MENEKNNEFPKILIVEDNETERASLKVALEAESFIVETVKNGFEAENIGNLSVFDAVLVDYKLPDIDGLNLIKKLKQSVPELMFLVISAHNSAEITIEALKIGAYGYMPKPLDIPALTKNINMMIKEKGIAVASREKLVELQSKTGINYKYNDNKVSIITTPDPDMLVSGKVKVSVAEKIKRTFKAVKNFYWGA